ncbi:MAG: YigZ family protein [Bacteroidales bacterium]|nr:YigZ family protein [Bacteroidales bacterium]MCF8405036.1 YigZ family protein [Bacteroidales bacterium]
MFEDVYKTIEVQSDGLYKSKGSKFISLVFPVKSLEEVKLKLEEVRNSYHDARHHCYAYMIGYDKSASRMNDDGEPSGSAGRPIMGQILSHDLTNVLVIVVRYFGGTKLGIRGLIDAYKYATLDALNKIPIVEKTVNEIYSVDFEYPLMNQVMKIVKDDQLNILSQNFEMKCNLTFEIRKLSAEKVFSQFQKINGVKINYLRTI